MSATWTGRVVVILAAVTLAPWIWAGQAVTPTAEAWAPPRLPDGRPDFQGVWTNATITPLERPRDLSGKAFFTEEEAAEYEGLARARNDADVRSSDPQADLSTGYNDFWWDRGTTVVSTLRTSLIVDPPDGRIPSLTPEAQRRSAARREAQSLLRDGPESFSLADRCIYRPNNGPPMLPGPYNNNYQIVQTPGHLVILIEMIHDARIVPIEGGPQLPSDLGQWMGDPHGHWEGDTLVIDTTNFTDRTSFRGSGPNLRVIERFTLVDDDTLLYEFTIDDPESFTRPWSGQLPMKRVEGMVYEYACHEGNYSLENMIKASRAGGQPAGK